MSSLYVTSTQSFGWSCPEACGKSESVLRSLRSSLLRNAGAHLLPAAGAERTRLAVRCSALLGRAPRNRKRRSGLGLAATRFPVRGSRSRFHFDSRVVG